MGKKKKSQLKPVTRGFATTSVPSKKAIVEAESQAASQTSEADGSVDTPGSVSASSQPFEVKNASQDNIDLELQALVDKLQDKTEREIGRTLKALEVDRRMAKSYRLLDFPALWRNQILELIREEQKQQVSKSSLLGESEDKLLPRFGILYGVLRRLGLSQAHTMECLSANRRLDLEEALEWVYLAALEGQLVWEQAIPQPRQTSRSEYSHQSMVKMLPASTNISSESLSTGDGRSVVVLSKTGQRDKISTTGRVQLTQTGDATDAGPVANTNAHSSDEEGDSPIEETDLNIMHAILRLQVLRIQKSGQLASQKERVAGLEKRIRDIEKDYLYSSRLANVAFTSGKAEMEAKLLQDRLRAGAEPGQLPTQPESHLPTEEVGMSLPTSSSAENAPDDSGGEEDTDTMFGNLLDEMPKEEVLSNGVVVMVKDMATKHWNGKTARFLLADTIKRRDRYATIHYQVISGGSRAVRCECIIRWTGGKVDQWKMEKVACHDSNQAEDYISTLALHDITYPLSVGFAGAPPSGNAPLNHRLLAPVFRDLWMELEGLRKSEEDSVNRQVWSDLRSIARDRIVIREAGNKLSRVPDSIQDRQPSYSTSISKTTQEELIRLISSRQSTPAYQSMLKTRLSLPIAAYRHEILETLETHQILVLSGETGCGKSTQVPAFIMEDQLSRGKTCKVICTEPRRISAISLAQRVSAEMGEPAGAVGTNNSLIGYSIRLESNISKSTRLAFVTNGIALRMLEGNDDTGASIDEVTHIIVDEVRSRTIMHDSLFNFCRFMSAQ
ncbi:hypothetical protein FRC19_010953 [Serendipita sp. 401]|nr:hypothetical protein FRC19_010953 [Serendipita sp. 401]